MVTGSAIFERQDAGETDEDRDMLPGQDRPPTSPRDSRLVRMRGRTGRGRRRGLRRPGLVRGADRRGRLGPDAGPGHRGGRAPLHGRRSGGCGPEQDPGGPAPARGPDRRRVRRIARGDRGRHGERRGHHGRHGRRRAGGAGIGGGPAPGGRRRAHRRLRSRAPTLPRLRTGRRAGGGALAPRRLARPRGAGGGDVGPPGLRSG